MRKATSYLVLILVALLLAISAAHWTVAQETAATEDVVAENPPDRNQESDTQSVEFENEQEEADEDWDSYEHDEDHECEEYEIEADLLLLELRPAQAEHAHLLAEISEDHVGTASWVISEIQKHLDEQSAAEFLKQLLNEVEDTKIRRLIQFKLIQLHADLDQPEQVKEQLRQIILGQ